MAKIVKKSLRTWMIIYVAFGAAFFSAVASGLQEEPALLHVPAVETTGSALERRFFEARLARSARNDI